MHKICLRSRTVKDLHRRPKAQYHYCVAGDPQVKFPTALAALILCTPAISSSAELRAQTLAAWDQYIGAVDARVHFAPAAQRPFLWTDENPGRAQRVQRGEVIVSQIKAESAPNVPYGLIHDWIGAAFVPSVTLTEVLALAHDYDSYPRWYGPMVARAELLGRDGDEDRFTILYVRIVLWVTAALEAEYTAHYVRVDATRWYSIAQSSRIQEFEQYGRSDQRKLPPDDGNGYLWRTYSVTRYEQRDNGVYIEQENIGLSRRIPPALRWTVEPVVKRLSRNLLIRSLQQTREALVSKSAR